MTLYQVILLYIQGIQTFFKGSTALSLYFINFAFSARKFCKRKRIGSYLLRAAHEVRCGGVVLKSCSPG
jgi:hypothetical protein